MKLTRNLIFGMMAATSAVAVAGVGGTVAQEGLGFKNAEAVTPMRRIWVVNQTDENTFGDTTTDDNNVTTAGFFIHAWQNKGSESRTGVRLIRAFDDVEKGVFYADIPASLDRLLFKTISTEGDWSNTLHQTEDQILPPLGSTGDVFYLHQGHTGGVWKQNCAKGTLSFKNYWNGNMKLSWLMGFYDTCSDSSAYGYMAYPQIMADFIDPWSDAPLSETVSLGSGDKGYNGKLPTIQEKLDAMRLKYEAATK